MVGDLQWKKRSYQDTPVARRYYAEMVFFGSGH